MLNLNKNINFGTKFIKIQTQKCHQIEMFHLKNKRWKSRKKI